MKKQYIAPECLILNIQVKGEMLVASEGYPTTTNEEFYVDYYEVDEQY